MQRKVWLECSVRLVGMQKQFGLECSVQLMEQALVDQPERKLIVLLGTMRGILRDILRDIGGGG
jgi:hypothetical protein